MVPFPLDPLQVLPPDGSTLADATAVLPAVARVLLAAALGMFLGLEREWSHKAAGIRTFTLTSVVGAVATVLESPVLLAVGGGLVLVQSVLLGAQRLHDDWRGEETGLALTTGTSLLLAYGVGILVADGQFLLGATVALLTSFLLVLRRELHGFAESLSKEEVRSAAEFAIVAFVVYPLLPTGTYGPWDAVAPRTVWLLVVAVGAIGFVNYALVKRYGGRGVALTGFLGGLVNSTAVVGEVADRARRDAGFRSLAVGTILLADAAMALRNLALVAVFVPETALVVGAPLALVALVAVALGYVGTDWSPDADLDLEAPFDIRSALRFGLLFLLVLVVAAGAQATFGVAGFLVTSALSGLVSSGSTTTTAVTLASTGQVSPTVAAAGVLAGTLASVLVKVGLAASVDRSLLRPVAVRTLALVAVGGAGGLLAVSLA